MLDGIAELFNSEIFMPHGHCFLWIPGILWLHVISDAIIGVAYYSIPVAIVYFARRRADLPFRYIFILFSAFILLCGSTHLLSVWVVWNPDYGPEGIVKALTALVSAATAVVVWKIMPTAMLLPSPRALQEMNAKLRDTNQRIEHEVAIRTDELRETERKLYHAQKMEAIGNLTGGMAHDFNNLLSVIIGNLDMLDDRLGADAKSRLFARAALDASLRGADLTRRLLAFARQQPLQPQLVDINHQVREITCLLDRTLGENIEITLHLDPEVWPVSVDSAQLEATLTNLATNARDSMPHGGKLTFVTGNRQLDAEYAARFPEVTPGDYAMIEVADTGVGMAPEIVGRIFEPFFTTKARGKGTGLGLAMAFGFMKQSGGHINVYSEPGVGSTFRLYLPRAVKAETTGEARTSPVTDGRGHETILVVEDNEAVRSIVVRQLNDLGYRVVEAVDAAAALARLRDGGEPIDLLFTDIVMPGKIDGMELARQVRVALPSLKVVLTSGFSDNHLNQIGEQNGREWRLLSKPYRKDDLARLLRQVLDE
jgi:signal transduction histidine kinase